jgi:hypothetical protein
MANPPGRLTCIITGSSATVVAILAAVAIAACGSTSTTTKTVTAPAHAVASSTTRSSAKPRHYSGKGSESIGNVIVKVPSTLHWTCKGCAAGKGSALDGAALNFIIEDNEPGWVGVNALGNNSGETAIAAGTYPDFQIVTDGTLGRSRSHPVTQRSTRGHDETNHDPRRLAGGSTHPGCSIGQPERRQLSERYPRMP